MVVKENIANLERLNIFAKELEISYVLIAKVKDVLTHLLIQPEIFPILHNKSVQLEYENEEVYIEFEILDDNVMKAFVLNLNDNTTIHNNTLELKAENIINIIERYFIN